MLNYFHQKHHDQQQSQLYLEAERLTYEILLHLIIYDIEEGWRMYQ